MQKPFDGWYVALPRAATWVEYEDVDFGATSPSKVKMMIRSKKGAEIALSAEENKDFATIKVPASKKWTEVTAPMALELTGINYIRATVNSGDVEIDWVTFE